MMIFLITNKHERLKWVVIPTEYGQKVLPGFNAYFAETEQAKFFLQKKKIEKNYLNIIRVFPKTNCSIQLQAAKHLLGLNYISKGGFDIMDMRHQRMKTGSCNFAYYPSGHILKVHMKNDIEVIILECDVGIVEEMSAIAHQLSKYVRAYRQNEQQAIISTTYTIAYNFKVLFEEILNHHFETPHETELYISEKTNRLIRLMFHHIRKMRQTIAPKTDDYFLYLNIKDYIDSYSGQKMDIDLVSKEFNKCRTAICNIFKQYSKNKLSIGQYIIQAKMKKAATLLIKEQLSIIEIAYALGYNNVSSFHKAFKNRHNYTPRQYKMRHNKMKHNN